MYALKNQVQAIALENEQKGDIINISKHMTRKTNALIKLNMSQTSLLRSFKEMSNNN